MIVSPEWRNSLSCSVMRERGLEPLSLAAPDPKISAASLTHGAYRGKRTARALHAVAQNSTELHVPCDMGCNMAPRNWRPTPSRWSRLAPFVIAALVAGAVVCLVVGFAR